MGRFRCLSKPYKRFVFFYADRISNKWIEIVKKKYALKYINKLNKLLHNNSYDIEVLHTREYFRIPGLHKFIIELDYKLNLEKGLAHSKAREYWIRRPPRLIIILLLSILITIGLAEVLINVSPEDHVYSLLIGINMILFSVYMLYQRLIDSISGAMMRIGHDHYKTWKSNLNYLRVTCL